MCDGLLPMIQHTILMSKFHTTINQWGLVSGIRQTNSDMISVTAPRSPFAPDARKGQLIVVVEAEGDVARGRQACTLVAETICEVFYADGSPSITSSLRQAVKAANAALYKYNFDAPPHKRTLVGATCAVIHGSDLFLTQVPPAQAFVAHTAKLRALPVPPSWTNGADPSAVNRQGSLGTSLGSEPEFSCSLVQPGDTIVLCSSNVARLIGKHQAEQLICYSDGQAIAEELYQACRAASLPEAHAIVLEAVAGPAPHDHNDLFTPVAVADKPRPVRHRWSGLFGRGSRAAPTDTTSQDAPAPDTSAVAVAPDVVASDVAASPQPTTAAPPLTVMDTLPVADVVPLPPSAFLGEGDYGGTVRPPAVPRRNRQVDLSDNYGTPVDFAAIPRKAPPPPPTVGERLTLPLRAVFVTLLGGFANMPRRTARPAERGPAPGLRLKGLSYRKQRPPLPWFNILLIVGVVALLVVVGIQQNRRRDRDTVNLALDKVTAAVTAARRSPDETVARQRLAEAEAALNTDVSPLVQSGMITTTKTAAWSRYLDVRTSYDRAMASINRIGFVDDLTPVATLPGNQGLIERIVLGASTVTDTNPPLYYLDRSAGVLYQQGVADPILKPDVQVGPFVTKQVRGILWREGSIIALDRGDKLFPIYHVYLRNGDNWLANQLNQTEWMEPAEGDLPMASYGGHLYVWDGAKGKEQLWKYASGDYANKPTPWITNAGGAKLDQVVSVQIDGQVYLLNRDGSLLVFEGGTLKKQLPAPKLTIPVSNVTRFVVTPDELEADGATIKRPGFIYLLDLRNERILQLKKDDGTLVQQIQARTRGPLNQISDLAVDEKQRMLYLANGASVLRAKLPDPSEVAVEETTTATPAP